MEHFLIPTSGVTLILHLPYTPIILLQIVSVTILFFLQYTFFFVHMVLYSHSLETSIWHLALQRWTLLQNWIFFMCMCTISAFYSVCNMACALPEQGLSKNSPKNRHRPSKENWRTVKLFITSYNDDFFSEREVLRKQVSSEEAHSMQRS